MLYRAVNPKNGQILTNSISFLSRSQIETCINKSYNAFREYKNTDLEFRLEKIKNLRLNLQKHKKRFSEIIVDEVGKPYPGAELEIDKAMNHCKFYEDNSARFLQPTKIDVGGPNECEVVYQPIGPLLVIMPWNFPFWLTFKSSISQLALGNTVMLKPAPSTPQCGIALEELFVESGLKNVYQNVFLSTDDTEFVISNPHVQGVAFTGSTRAGKTIAELAGKHLKKCSLELGGSDPFIVLEDANIVEAATKG